MTGGADDPTIGEVSAIRVIVFKLLNLLKSSGQILRQRQRFNPF
jgi:hypothetical protein